MNTINQTTLADAVRATRCRKGKATGTTRRGAYWLAIEPIAIRRSGGDGIGQSSADVTHMLELRHFRTDEVRAVINRFSFHQNGCDDSYHAIDIGECITTEDVIVKLKAGIKDDGQAMTCYSDYMEDKLITALGKIGLPARQSAPDETVREESSCVFDPDDAF